MNGPEVHQRVVVGSTATLTYTHVDQDGEPVNASGSVTVVVNKADGTEHTASATATSAGNGVYTTSVTVGADLELLSAVWTADGIDHTTLVAVVGGVYFAKADMASILDVDLGRYTSADFVTARVAAENEVESVARRSGVPRFRRDRLMARNGCLTIPERDGRAVSAVSRVSGDGTLTAYSASEVANIYLDDVELRRVDGTQWVGGEYVVAYTYGLDRPPPLVKWATIKRTRYWLNQPKSGVPDRATSFTSDAGATYRLSTPGLDRTGDPDVDAVLLRWGERFVIA